MSKSRPVDKEAEDEINTIFKLYNGFLHVKRKGDKGWTLCEGAKHSAGSAKAFKEGKHFFVGYFDSEEEAALAWNYKATELGFSPESFNKVFEDIQ